MKSLLPILLIMGMILFGTNCGDSCTDSDGCTDPPLESVTVEKPEVTPCAKERTLLCHKDEYSKCVQNEAVDAHLDHGDYLDICDFTNSIE